MRRRVAIAGAGMAGALALGFGIPAIAVDEADPPGSTQDSQPRAERHAALQGELAERLAAELGLETADVEAALEKVTTDLREERRAERLDQMEQRLADAVESGRLTQEQADALLAAAEAGEGLGFGRGHGRGHGGHFGGPFGGGLDLDRDSEDVPSSTTTSRVL